MILSNQTFFTLGLWIRCVILQFPTPIQPPVLVEMILLTYPCRAFLRLANGKVHSDCPAIISGFLIRLPCTRVTGIGSSKRMLGQVHFRLNLFFPSDPAKTLLPISASNLVYPGIHQGICKVLGIYYIRGRLNGYFSEEYMGFGMRTAVPDVNDQARNRQVVD